MFVMKLNSFPDFVGSVIKHICYTCNRIFTRVFVFSPKIKSFGCILPKFTNHIFFIRVSVYTWILNSICITIFYHKCNILKRTLKQDNLFLVIEDHVFLFSIIISPMRFTLKIFWNTFLRMFVLKIWVHVCICGSRPYGINSMREFIRYTFNTNKDIGS